MNTGEITEELWGIFSQQEEQEKGSECEDDCECKDGSLADQHPRIDFSHHLDMTECTEAEIEDHCKEKREDDFPRW